MAWRRAEAEGVVAKVSVCKKETEKGLVGICVGTFGLLPDVVRARVNHAASQSCR